MPIHLQGHLADPARPAAGDYCPIDRTIQIVGTRSAMLLLREAFYGTTRFDDFAARVGITEAVASSRLRELVAAGLLERRPYREPGQRTRQEYILTASGTELMPALLALASWGRKHVPRDHTPTFRHHACGAEAVTQMRCADGHVIDVDDLVVES